MPKLWLTQQRAQKCLYKAHERIVTGFDSSSGGQDRLGWFDGRRKRSYASGSATCCTRQR